MLDKTKTKKVSSSSEFVQFNGEAAKVAHITIIVDGITPLLTHNPQSMVSTTSTAKGSIIPTPEVEAERGCYRTEDGKLCIKGDSFRGALLAAAGAWKVKGGGKATMKSRLSHITVVDDLIPLNHKDGTAITSYELDCRRVMLQKNGVIRARPKFSDWSCQVTIEYDSQVFRENPAIICQILSDAGARIGVGDFRPQKNGWFGRFSVRAYKVEE